MDVFTRGRNDSLAIATAAADRNGRNAAQRFRWSLLWKLLYGIICGNRCTVKTIRMKPASDAMRLLFGMIHTGENRSCESNFTTTQA
ncbi:hypothetical protein E2C01_032786 [Portunus trituberculatus]|uniref:Uncharacterized protein n=1 Tax=Portunus trituberculatus TaxID=210409 RepID=A0A5B7F1N5_PORTR|nr:hypothetical protein [Portunus trituberculatus]